MAYPKGKKFTDEQRARVSAGVRASSHAESMKNSKAVKEHAAKLRTLNTGLKRSAETRARMSASKRYAKDDPRWQTHYDARLKEIVSEDKALVAA